MSCSSSTPLRHMFRQAASSSARAGTVSSSPSPLILSHSLRHASTSSSSSSPASSSSSTGKNRNPPSSRQLPLRKRFLIEQYTQILSTNQVVVFLKPEDFTVAELTRLRVDLATIPPVVSSSSAPSADDINEEQGNSTRPRFIYLRPGLLPPTLKGLPHIPSEQILSHIQNEGGNIAALTLKSLHPPTLKAALRAVQKLSSLPNVRKQQAAAQNAASAGGASKGGRGAPPYFFCCLQAYDDGK